MFGAAVVLYSAAGMALAAYGAEIPKPVAGKVFISRMAHGAACRKPDPMAKCGNA
jgi:hypothetical protein